MYVNKNMEKTILTLDCYINTECYYYNYKIYCVFHLQPQQLLSRSLSKTKIGFSSYLFQSSNVLILAIVWNEKFRDMLKVLKRVDERVSFTGSKDAETSRAFLG